MPRPSSRATPPARRTNPSALPPRTVDRGVRVLIGIALAAAYYFAAWFCAGLASGRGHAWIATHAAQWSLERDKWPYLLSALDGLGLVIVSLPLAYVLWRVYGRRAAVCGLAVAAPATLTLLANLWLVSRMGFSLPTAAQHLAMIDAAKTLLIPALLTLLWEVLRPATRHP
ncbi:MAG TPA: hypothetical protein VFQ88_01380 [Nevskiaceae bacterium]|nr:hypothetical protein [Nevskiaceae bacterium]